MKKQVQPGDWVSHERNRGLCVGEAPAGTGGERCVWVKFLAVVPVVAGVDGGKSRKVFQRPFSDTAPVMIAANALDVIPEPRLEREDAAAYLGLTPSRVYQLRREGWFGGMERDGFYALPTELDAYTAAPKAKDRWHADDVRKEQAKYKRVKKTRKATT